MSKVDEALTRRVADLAKLALSEEEVTLFTSQLSQILKYVDKLEDVSVEGVSPLTQPFEMETPLREDVHVPFEARADERSRILDCAPSVIDDGFKVPQVVG